MIKIEDFNFDHILFDEKLYIDILIYDTSYKTLIVGKLLHIMFNQVDEYSRVCNGTTINHKILWHNPFFP